MYQNFQTPSLVELITKWQKTKETQQRMKWETLKGTNWGLSLQCFFSQRLAALDFSFCTCDDFTAARYLSARDKLQQLIKINNRCLICSFTGSNDKTHSILWQAFNTAALRKALTGAWNICTALSTVCMWRRDDKWERLGGSAESRGKSESIRARSQAGLNRCAVPVFWDNKTSPLSQLPGNYLEILTSIYLRRQATSRLNAVSQDICSL